jgi:hypothetical protein
MTTSYDEVVLTTPIRRKAEKIISSYRKVKALIKNLQMELPELKLTPTYELREGSSGGEVSNTIEAMYLKKEYIREEVAKNELIIAKLDIIYDCLNDIQKKIWEYKYLDGRFDDGVIEEIDIRRNNYYNEKNDIIVLVAKSFCLF